jgi:hypothetical protein
MIISTFSSFNFILRLVNISSLNEKAVCTVPTGKVPVLNSLLFLLIVPGKPLKYNDSLKINEFQGSFI